MLGILHNIFELLAPQSCVFCDTSVSMVQNNLCHQCSGQFFNLINNCEICSSELDEGICNFCSNREVYFDRNISLFQYNDEVKELLHQIKFNNLKYLYIHFSELIFKKLVELDIDLDLITYVPMNSKKKWSRGYNQSEIIARDVAKKMKIICSPVFSEVSNAGTQRELGYKERFINVLGRYEIDINKVKDKIFDKKIMVIDDVFTSGATLNEISRKLKEYGVKEVITLTIAKTKTEKY